jgi:hypothetical protein
LTWGRYKAAAEPVDMEELKISEDEEEDDAVMEDVAEGEQDEEEEDDAALEDIKDLYDDDEDGTGKKRKRLATDDGEDQKSGRKKVHYLQNDRLIVEIGCSCTTNEKT